MKFRDLDYFETYDGIIFIVRGNIHTKNAVLSCPVYWPDLKGDRLSASGKSYRKEIVEVANNPNLTLPYAEKNPHFPQNVFLVSKKAIVRHFSPKSVIKKFEKEFFGTIWWKIFQAMIAVGVPKSDIGIFGSYLVGLNKNVSGEMVKDIDFLVYGRENCLLLKNRMMKIFQLTGLSGITADHIEYETKKLGGKFSKSRNNFVSGLANKWSSIQVAPGVLTTIRFVAKDNEVEFSEINSDPVVGEINLSGEVISDFGLNFVPRTFKILSEGKTFQISTYFWVFHQALKIGDKVQIFANLYSSGAILIDKYDQGIKIIGGTNEFLSLQSGNLYSTEISR